MSLVSLIGPRPNLLGLDSGGENMRLEVSQPVLTNEDPGAHPQHRNSCTGFRTRLWASPTR